MNKLLLPLVLIALVGCSTTQLSPKAKAFVSLRSTQILVDSLMQTYANHVVTGSVKPEQQTQIEEQHKLYQQLYAAAVQVSRFGTGQKADDQILAAVRTLEILVTSLK